MGKTNRYYKVLALTETKKFFPLWMSPWFGAGASLDLNTFLYLSVLAPSLQAYFVSVWSLLIFPTSNSEFQLLEENKGSGL